MTLTDRLLATAATHTRMDSVFVLKFENVSGAVGFAVWTNGTDVPVRLNPMPIIVRIVPR